MEKSKRSWEEIVNNSGGSLLFLPSEFKKQAEQWQKDRKEYNSLVQEMARKEMSLNQKFQNLIFALREYLEKNGRPDIWLKDVGLETSALDEGKFVVSLVEPNKSRLPMS